jgi:hypothetical protein
MTRWINQPRGVCNDFVQNKYTISSLTDGLVCIQLYKVFFWYVTSYDCIDVSADLVL